MLSYLTKLYCIFYITEGFLILFPQSHGWHILGGNYLTLMRFSEKAAILAGGEDVKITKHTFGGVPTTIYTPLEGQYRSYSA